MDDPHSSRRSRGQLRTKIECGEGTIPVKSRQGAHQIWSMDASNALNYILVGCFPSEQVQGFGSGSGSAWIRINLSWWIRIRIRIQIADPDPDPGGQKCSQKTEKRTEFSSFEVLDVLF